MLSSVFLGRAAAVIAELGLVPEKTLDVAIKL